MSITKKHPAPAAPTEPSGLIVKRLRHAEWGQGGDAIGMAIGFGGKKLCGTDETAEGAAIALVEQVLVSVETRFEAAAEYGEIPPQVLSRVRRLNAGFIAKLRGLHAEVKREVLDGVYDELTQELRPETRPMFKIDDLF